MRSLTISIRRGTATFWCIGGHEIEVGLALRLQEVRQFPGVDPVRTLYDLALGGLPEHFRQMHDRNGLACDDVGERLSRPNGRELVDVADEDDSGIVRHGLEK